MYEYEYITDNSKEYLDKIYQIEDLKEELKNALNCSGIIENDIYETNKLEGNQLTREETDDFLLNDITIRGKSFRDYAQISNFTCVLDAAKNWVYNQENAELSIDMILIMHHMIIANELSQNESGIFRDNAVHIRTTSYIPPDATFVSDYMQELVDKYNQTIESTKTSFEKICEFKRNFERIHPFFDGNG
jgi:Fic family protein